MNVPEILSSLRSLYATTNTEVKMWMCMSKHESKQNAKGINYSAMYVELIKIIE